MVLQLLCAIPVLAAMALSATFAFEFGATKGATVAFAWLYGFAFAAFDVSKAFWPIQASRWSQQGNRGAQVSCWLLFVLCTLWSLYSHFGITALQLASKTTNQTVAAKTQDSKQITLDRLRKQRDDIPRFTTTTREAVKTAEDAVTTAAEQAAAERTRGGCRELCRQREAEEREARTALKKAQEDKAATDAAKELDDKITLAEAAVGAVDQIVVHQETDAQSGALATMLGLDKGRVSSAGQLGFAFILEIFSGLGLWALGFGHGERRRVEVAVEPLEPVIAADVEDAVTIETPADAAYRILSRDHQARQRQPRPALRRVWRLRDHLRRAVHQDGLIQEVRRCRRLAFRQDRRPGVFHGRCARRQDPCAVAHCCRQLGRKGRCAPPRCLT